jgi:alpha-L-fucosidase
MKNSFRCISAVALFAAMAASRSFGATATNDDTNKELTEAEIAAFQDHGANYVNKDPRQFIKDPKVLKKLTEWQDWKFGFMVHWGACSQWGARESWTLSAEKDWGRSTMPQWKESGENLDKYREMYWNLNKTFNPSGFSASQWAKLAKTAGMKYFVFTTMHHDGFCMFDSKFTDYKITGKDCPYNTSKTADVTKELFNAFRQEGLKIGAYYSKPSWHNDNFWIKGQPAPTRNANYDITKEPERWERFVQFTHNQITQLMSDYGPIDILWLDGGWVKPNKNGQDIRMNEIAANARRQQPGLIVVDRATHGEFENYVTPEQQIPKQALDYPWETCMTMGRSRYCQ